MSSPDVRTVEIELESGKVITVPDPFWPPIAYNFPVDPSEIYDWATYIFNAADFNELFEE